MYSYRVLSGREGKERGLLLHLHLHYMFVFASLSISSCSHSVQWNQWERLPMWNVIWRVRGRRNIPTCYLNQNSQVTDSTLYYIILLICISMSFLYIKTHTNTHTYIYIFTFILYFKFLSLKCLFTFIVFYTR